MFIQMDKNTVSAADQLKQTGPVRFFNSEGKGKRIMFVGNSITLHDICTDIGWYGKWGMAASSEENDYVHRIMSKTCEKDSDVAVCVCQVAEWERQYKQGETIHCLYEAARDFNTDIIVMRFVENCPKIDFDKLIFKKETIDLLQYLNPSKNAKIILTTGFWRHPADDGIAELAEELNLPLVKLGDLGENEEMKAIGLFEHSGVANHPGDLGMKEIADRIFAVLEKYL